MTSPTASAATSLGLPVGAGREPVVPGLPAGAARTSITYYDEQGVRRRAADPVPVDQYGALAGIQFTCRRCKSQPTWAPITVKKQPACPVCGTRMNEVRVKAAPMLPWRQIWDAVRAPLVPVFALGGEYAAGASMHGAGIPGLALAGLTPAVGVVTTRMVRRRLLKAAEGRNAVDVDAPNSDRQVRDAIDRQARACGYTATAGAAWLALAAALGVDPSTPSGAAALAALGLTWIVPAASWWKRLRGQARNQPPADIPADAGGDEAPPVDPDEAFTRRVWRNIVAARQGQVIGQLDGKDVTAPRNGKLGETWIEDWHKVAGGCAWTAVSPPGLYVADNFVAARPAVASAFRMKTSMITCIPDPEDETRALYLAQRSSPIVDDVRWSGPTSVDVVKGTAPVARYIDGGMVPYEIYRPGWGVPHVAAFGTTGSGKSEFLNLLFTIDRWAHHVDEHGVARGLVADFLIDPQQGQSFAPFLDDLAAPVAASLEEAMLLVEALTEEMLRRNRYLAREAKTWDERRKKWRTGRKWWNPLIDGPILALTIDEAHDYLSDRRFATLVTKAGRMWRKCGGQLRIGTHTPLLTDLGGSMALRDMLTGGFVFVGRTANSLSGPTAFNGRLPVDPRTIPTVPGMAYILAGKDPKPMLARAMFEPDWYDFVRDVDDNVIGYPAQLPQVTVDTFGRAYAEWTAVRTTGGDWTPGPSAAASAEQVVPVRALDAVLVLLGSQHEPRDIDWIDEALRSCGIEFSTRTLREVLAKLRKADPPMLVTADGRHRLTDRGVQEAATRAELVNA